MKKLLEASLDGYKEYTMPNEVYHAVASILLRNGYRKSVGQVLQLLPKEIRAEVKVGRKRKIIPTGAEYHMVAIDELVPKTPTE